MIVLAGRLITLILPLYSRRRQLIKRLVKRPPAGIAAASISYEDWIEQCEPKLWLANDTDVKKPADQPLISIVVPCYNTPGRYVNDMIASVAGQLYQNWQLVLADGSTDASRAEYLSLQAEADARITYVRVTENLGIVGNTNEGLRHVTGSFVAFMDHDDTLSPHALAEVVQVIRDKPDSELIYSDEDKLSDDGKRRLLPFFKPDWSPELLLGVNYITHFVVTSRALVERINGLRPGFDGAQDYDFLLRLTEQTNHIVHIPKILYHWRLAEGSTAKNVGEKSYADTAGQRALRDAAGRRGIAAEVIEIPERPTNYRLKFHMPSDQPLISIIIPFKDKAELLRQCVGSITAKTTYPNYEIILVSNNSTEPETHEYLKELSTEPRCKIHYWDHPFNYSKVNNFGRKQASGEYLVLLNNDTEVITETWLEELVGMASQPEIGAVGPLLYYPDKTIQHAGVILGMGTMAGHVFRRRQPGDWTEFGIAAWPRNYLAVTAACLAIKASKYDEVGGLDEIFTVAGNDVALGISLYQKGYRNVYWPFAELVHYENVSVGSYDNGIQLDYDHSLEYYRPYLNWNDPYFNANLDLMNEQVGGSGTNMSKVVKKAVQVYKNNGLKGVIKKSRSTLRYRTRALRRVATKKETLVEKDLREEYGLLSNEIFQISTEDIRLSQRTVQIAGPIEIRTATWFVPYFSHFAFGGIQTIFRYIEKLSIEGVENRIVIYDNPTVNTADLRKQIEDFFPRLQNYQLIIFSDDKVADIEDLPESDIAFCTLWVSAYLLLRFNKTKRKYYFIQDYEPLFYVAGSTYALAESTYRFGFRGVVNTPGLLAAINQRHGLEGISFIPAVNQQLYHPDASRLNERTRIFFYARPLNPRNAFNLGILTIQHLLEVHGDTIEIIAAGAEWNEADYG